MKKVRLLSATDIHQQRWLYRALIDAVRLHKPDILALVGDFLYAGEPSPSLYSEAECARHLAKLPCEVVFVRGNHEMRNWDPFVKSWLKAGRHLHIPHGDATVLGPLVITGFPCTFGNEESFLMGRTDVDYDVTTWFPTILEQYGSAARSLWLLHEPPAGTGLCAQEGLMAGVDEWRRAIELYQPWLTISGHDHETPVFDGYWHDRIGHTICINTGQPTRLTQRKKVFHYSLLDFEFVDDKPSLPDRVAITAFPWQETITVPK